MKYVEINGDTLIIRLFDRIDYRTGVEILNELTPIMEHCIKRADVYCGGLVHISDAGIRALVHIKRETGAEMILHNVSKSIKDVIAISLADFHFIFDDEKTIE